MGLNNIRLYGPQTITYKGVVLGHTRDGVEFTFEREFVDLTVDKYGSTAIDKALTGQRALVKFRLAEPTLYNIRQAIAEAEIADGASADRLNLGQTAGELLGSFAGLLTVHPIKNGADQSEDINLVKAVSIENVMIPYKNEQTDVEVTMEALVDESYEDGRRLGWIGPADIS